MSRIFRRGLARWVLQLLFFCSSVEGCSTPMLSFLPDTPRFHPFLLSNSEVLSSVRIYPNRMTSNSLPLPFFLRPIPHSPHTQSSISSVAASYSTSQRVSTLPPSLLPHSRLPSHPAKSHENNPFQPSLSSYPTQWRDECPKLER